ncbi:SERINE/THREONINE-PROTEIN KINASE-LIKE PROTEIN CCR4 [Salix purpurea]|uniref:non-specific serine/threonine protein kinase n=1 Tax=Salix purpurea TaxID=77065 RepID=A0A9Q0PPQ6_SALPP|nr:SERINE/THREONINE-PROTEIN KINASE-LIKE PROTEIN CCR4 [Salix purpurea]
MTVKLSNLSTIILIVVITSSLLHIAVVKSLGTASTIALTYSTPTACGIVAGEPTQRIQCYQNGRSISMQPNISFEAISGGFKLLVRPQVWRLTDLTVGDVQVCAREVSSGMVKCWRGVARRRSSFPSPGVDLRFSTIASGSGFTCGILMNSSRVHCWGNNDVGTEIERQFSNLTMLNLVAGESHACGLTRGGILVCKGSISSRQLDVPFNSAFEFSGVAAGANFTCAVKQRNGLVTCWGKTDIFQLDSYVSENYSFELIVAGMNFLCGLTTSNLSMICWGTGWYNDLNHRNDLPIGMIIPGSCIQSSCSTCGMYPNSETLCGGSGSICKSCRIERPLALPLPPITPPPPEEVQQALLGQSRNKLSLAFMIVGSLGAFAGISTIVYCLGGFLHKRYCNTVQPSITDVNANTGASVSNHYIAQPVRSFSIKSLGSTRLGFQRNGSSSRLTEKTQNFSLSELLAASNNFSLENKIGAGSFGTVYRGKLHGGREVAIKRGETAGMLRSVLDERVGQPGMPETEAVELMAYTALHSVKLEGKERPNITDIVAHLERALALCEEVHTSLSSTTFSIPSD